MRPEYRLTLIYMIDYYMEKGLIISVVQSHLKSPNVC